MRLFLEGRANVFLEGRASFSSFDEHFKFNRFSSPAVYDEFGYIEHGPLVARSIEDRARHDIIYPGIGLGIMPHLQHGLYLDLSIGVDFINFGTETAFSHVIEHDWNITYDVHEQMLFESQLQGSKKAFVVNVGLGVLF